MPTIRVWLRYIYTRAATDLLTLLKFGEGKAYTDPNHYVYLYKSQIFSVEVPI